MKRSGLSLMSFTVLLTLLMSAVPAVFAQGATPAATPAPAAATPAPPAAPTSGPRAEFQRLMEDAETKLLRLAEAVPAEKYTWRPGEGVRSVSEVFLHVAAGNYGILRRAGAQPPEGLDLRGLEKSTTEKAKVVEALKASFAKIGVQLRQKALDASKLTDADLDKTAPWFGDRQASYREILFFLAAHQHEHLGQSIAYARINGVIPPWTEERQQQQQSLKQPEKPKQ